MIWDSAQPRSTGWTLVPMRCRPVGVGPTCPVLCCPERLGILRTHGTWTWKLSELVIPCYSSAKVWPPVSSDVLRSISAGYSGYFFAHAHARQGHFQSFNHHQSSRFGWDVRFLKSGIVRANYCLRSVYLSSKYHFGHNIGALPGMHLLFKCTELAVFGFVSVFWLRPFLILKRRSTTFLLFSDRSDIAAENEESILSAECSQAV